jgi:hypothetical protein
MNYTSLVTRESGDPGAACERLTREGWIPACAGMSGRVDHALAARLPQRHGFQKGVVRLNHIRPAADGIARRKKHEALRLERRRAEMPARRKILGNLMAGRIAQPRKRNMRREFAPLRFETDAAQQPLMLGLQFQQRRRRRDQRNDRARAMPPEG